MKRTHSWTLGLAIVALGALAGCGSDGADGADGEQGPPGAEGAQGETGERGPRGSQGETGPAGDAGSAGPEGPAGETGEMGEEGRNLRLSSAGLDIVLQSFDIADDGTASVEFTSADDDGRPLDREGVLTDGEVSTSFVLSWLDETAPGAPLHYTAYTTREQTGEDTGITETQSSADSGGTYEELDDGRYRYTFGTTIDVAAGNEGKTHTVGVFADRAFDGLSYIDNETLDFLPNGGNVQTQLDIVTNNACNNCHTNLTAHGRRRGVEMCVLCHTPTNSIDPDTGNSFDFRIMVHKIHMGMNLPSVEMGEPYRMIGFRGSEHDFSEVAFPGEITNCAGCHTGAQGDHWKNQPSTEVCASCHDRTWFGAAVDTPEGWETHLGGPREEDECIVCHAEDSLYPITGLHLTPLFDPDAPQLVLSLVAVENAAAGATPEVVFGVSLDGQPANILSTPINRLRVRFAGPNTDFATQWEESIQDNGSNVASCGDPAVPPCIEADGANFRYYAATPLPNDAAGSFTVGLEGRVVQDTIRYAADNPTLAFAVTDASAVARRTVVTTQACNNCHQVLSFHGGNRRTVDYCVMCHNPNFVEGGTPLEGQSLDAHSVNFKDLIHGIHSAAHYPSDITYCGKCHVDDSHTLPLPPGVLPTASETRTCIEDPNADANTDCDDVSRVTAHLAPVSAACTSCHDSEAAAVHAEVNTSPTSGAEACATCHGSDRDHDVEVVHAQAP